MKPTFLLQYVLILSVGALARSPNRIEFYFTPQKFAALHDDLGIVMPMLYELTLEQNSSQKIANTSELVQNVDIIWVNYRNDPNEINVDSEERTLMQSSGEITVSFLFSFMPEDSNHYWIHNLQAEMTSEKLIFNRTFQKGSSDQLIESDLLIEWGEVRLIEVEDSDFDWNKLVRSLNSFKSKLENAIMQKLTEGLQHLYQAHDLQQKEETIYFVPYSQLIVEMGNQMQISELSSNAVVFSREYLLSSEGRPVPEHDWKAEFDPKSSEYQIAVGKPIVEYLLNYAFQNEYFAYIFSKYDNPIPGFSHDMDDLKIIFPQADKYFPPLEKTQMISLVCQHSLEMSPRILFVKHRNAILMHQKLFCGFGVSPTSRDSQGKIAKFTANLLLLFKIHYNKETEVFIEDVELAGNPKLITPDDFLLAENSEYNLKGWLESKIKFLRGKLVQIGTGFSLPIRNAKVFVKEDHLLFVGEPQKRLFNTYPNGDLSQGFASSSSEVGEL